jgi:hypothetical protein
MTAADAAGWQLQEGLEDSAGRLTMSAGQNVFSDLPQAFML